MVLLDSLMINGISWAIKTVVTAAEAEMNDDTALREQLLAAEMQREMGEITDDDFAEIERDLLGRIREIKERREGGSGPLAFGEGEPIESTADSRFQIEASISGDFHEPAEAPHTTIVEQTPPRRGIIGTESGQTERVLDVERVHAGTLEESALPLSATRTKRTKRASTTRTSRTIRTSRTSRTTSRRTKIR
jgi:hypothetical protein